MNIPEDWIGSGWIKVERAHEHIIQLDNEIRAFRARHPYVVVTEVDQEAGVVRFPIRAREGFPPMWSGVAADAIHNLRSALDILWRTVSREPRLRGRKDKRKGEGFPFASAKVLQARYARMKEPSLKTAMGIVLMFRPYEGGNDVLWKLDMADNFDKHQMPVICAVQLGTERTEPTFPEPNRLNTLSAFRVVARGDPRNAPPVEDGAEAFPAIPLSRFGTSRPMHMQRELAFEIAFGESGPLKGELVLQTLDDFAHTVEAIYSAFIAKNLIKAAV